ncbi:helix-turn-helix domain-containing protein [Konateibacter massiliensis]|uniref:hypothetical protein n=1 Tax=Konateibacter massiliensis TaxID=2002841 RepID=UPI000C149817|nr:hypothetical protein [Konateibacter massiliensis]
METGKKINADGLKYMIALAEIEEGRPSATKVAKEFGVNRSTVCRALADYVKEGLLDENFRFTQSGLTYIELYIEKKESILHTLVNKGMSYENARENALSILCNCDSEATEIIAKSMDSFYDGKKKKLQKEKKKSFSGDMANEYLRVGNYTASFLFLKTDKNKHGQVSMANEGFRHPGMLVISTEGNYLCLKLRMIERQSRFASKFLRGRLAGMKYEKNGAIYEVKIEDNCAYIPLEAFHFLYVKEDNILQGKAELIMSASVGALNMPESKAVLMIYC